MATTAWLMTRGRLAGAVLLALLMAACATEDGRRLRTVPRDHTGPLRTWWSDQQVKEEGHYVDGQPHGYLRRWHRNGVLAFEGDFDNGKPVGEVLYYHEGGTLARRESWKDGRLDGLVTEYIPDGTIVSQTAFRAGVKDGEAQQWFPDGSVALEGRWQAGLPAGTWRFHSQDGQLRREEHYFVADGAQIGRLTTEFAPGGGATLQELLTLKDGVWAGWRTYWHPNGRQAGMEEWVDGRRHGRDLSWTPAGGQLAEGRREDDQRVGVWTFWDGQGQVTRRVRYEAGAEVEVLSEVEVGGTG